VDSVSSARNDGFGELGMKNAIQVNTWPEAEEKIHEIERLNAGRPVWFRGQSDSNWQLLTTLERRTIRNSLVYEYLRLIRRIKPEIE
jgi:hypothetical protein